MLALVSAALSQSQSVLADSGHVDFAIGNVVVTDAQGQARTLAKGADVGTGDKITSGGDGRAQIRFSDGAFVSLQPNTEFEIKKYQFDGKADGTESALFSLFKGAMRTVTGLVGRVNHNKYQIATPTATIGIRGTGGLISVGGDGSTLVTGTSGIWTLSNNGGTLEIPAGTSGFAGGPNLPPRQTTEGPVIPPNQPVTPPTTTVVEGDVVNSQGTPVSIAGPTLLTSGPGYAVGVVAEFNCDCSVSPVVTPPADTVFNASGQMTQFVFSDASFNSGRADGTYTLAGSHADFGTADGILAWGRWTGDVLKDGTLFNTYASDDGLHYVVGIPTPVAGLPTANTTFTYALIGATQPTYVGGGVAPGTLTGASLTGNFASGAVAVNLNAQDGNGLTYNGSAIGSMNKSVAGALFSASDSAATGTGCSPTCSLDVNGFFAGNAASHAGVSYMFSGQSGELIGAAAFKR